MNTSIISLIEKNSQCEGGTFDHVKNIEIKNLQTNAHFILLQKLIGHSEIPVLLQIENNQLTTLLDCTDLTPYEFWYFDEAF